MLINLRKNARRSILAGILLSQMGLFTILSFRDETPSVIMGTFLLVIGFYKIGYIDRLALDKGKMELLHQKGFIIPFSVKRYPKNKIRKITLIEKTVNRGSKSSSVYPVRLTGIKDAVVSISPDPWFARFIAESLAGKLSVDFNNRVYKKASVRTPDALDLPIVEKWTSSGMGHTRPALPANTGLVEKRGTTYFKVTLPAERENIKFSVMLIACTLFMALFFYRMTREYAIVLILFFGGVIIFLLYALLSFCGRSSLFVNRKTIGFRQGWAPLKSRIQLDEVEEFIVADGIHLVGDRKCLWIPYAGNLHDSAYLAAVIPFEISRLYKTGNEN